MSKQAHSHDHEHNVSFEVEVRDGCGRHRPIARAQIGLYDAPDGDGHVTANSPALDVRCTDEHGRVCFEATPGRRYQLAFLHAPFTTSDKFNVDACTGMQHLKPDVDAVVDSTWLSIDGNGLGGRLPRADDQLVVTVSAAAAARPQFVTPGGWRRIPGYGGSDCADDAGNNGSSGSSSGTKSAAVGGRNGDRWSEEFTPLSITERLEANFAVHLPSLRSGEPPASLFQPFSERVAPVPTQPVSGRLGIALSRTETEHTEDLPLWLGIRNGTEALSFNRYLRFMDVLFSGHRGHRRGGGGHGHGFDAEKEAFDKLQLKRFLPFNDSDSYRVLKAATEAFVMVNCGVLQSDDDDGEASRKHRDKAFRQRQDNAYLDRRDLPAFDDTRGAFEDYLEGPRGLLPYLALVARKLPDIPIIEGNPDGANLAVGFVHEKLASPCLVELIWSYWHEEAMLVQTMNAVTRRFQNRAAPGTPDPLANLEIDPLRPLNSLLWGYTQDEQHRLTVNRRNAEYDHQYGLRLRGKAVKDYRTADSRSQFLEGFHHLLRLLTTFYKQDDDTTVKADAFPVLNALKEVHLVMSQGAHNNFGELATTARIEMLMQQWLLGRPEFREFLPSRIMVAYPEPWMDRVDAMKKLQGWTDTSVVHFRNLAIFGEQMMLSIRFGAWSEVYEPTQAFNWARFWRPQVQGYIHAYRAATGIDLASDTFDPAADATLPSLLMQRRLAQQQRNA